VRHVFATMGTVASIDIANDDERMLPALERVFDEVDQRFSLYRPRSELRRIADGQLTLTDASDTLRASYARALGWRGLTDGHFSPHRPDGVVDLNGIVKAEAIEQAGRLLTNGGCRGWTINVGGDILVDSAHGSRPIGITDPTDASALLCSVSLGALPTDTRRALATSGSAQRGDHIWLGGELRPAPFVQVTVIADDIVTADVLATAIVAGGTRALDQFTAHWDIDVLAVDRAGDLVATPGFRAGAGVAPSALH